MFMKTCVARSVSRRDQRGLSLVELMVGITVGLFVVAAAATLVANQLSDNRRLLLETQVQQDLRATMDIITRQMRRAGAVKAAHVEAGIAASPAAGGAIIPFTSMSPLSATSSETQFSFYFDEDQQGPYGFKLDGGTIKTLMPRIGLSPQWQELTDPNTVVVTALSITPRVVSSVSLPCPKLCADGTQSCWPKLIVRSYIVNIQARAKSDPAVQRALRNDVRVRNDLVEFNGPTSTSPICPA
ncbi:MAG: prepilin-type N-terminal cleavage/methylation domain-containing protein [Betaproteobacteria bacterium]|nr:prepilin-type N-terminal cleavage/methylation domain-containing protein [Betaproteobacteria bacterium]